LFCRFAGNFSTLEIGGRFYIMNKIAHRIRSPLGRHDDFVDTMPSTFQALDRDLSRGKVGPSHRRAEFDWRWLALALLLIAVAKRLLAHA